MIIVLDSPSRRRLIILSRNKIGKKSFSLVFSCISTYRPQERDSLESLEVEVKRSSHWNSNPSSHSVCSNSTISGDGGEETRSVSAASSTTDVKRVRALFENNTGANMSGNGSSCSEDENHQNQIRNKFLKTNNITPKSFLVPNSRTAPVQRKCSSPNRRETGTTILKSAYSQLSLNQMERYDLIDLLVNDNVVIEDSPDLFQSIRNTR